jgi:hypothetical protein
MNGFVLNGSCMQIPAGVFWWIFWLFRGLFFLMEKVMLLLISLDRMHV